MSRAPTGTWAPVRLRSRVASRSARGRPRERMPRRTTSSSGRRRATRSAARRWRVPSIWPGSMGQGPWASGMEPPECAPAGRAHGLKSSRGWTRVGAPRAPDLKPFPIRRGAATSRKHPSPASRRSGIATPAILLSLPGDPVKILVVDDSPTMRRIIIGNLVRMGHAEVVEGENGRAGLEQVTRGGVDLIITDWDMPEMDGLDFVRAVRAGGGAMPILMVTTRAATEDILQALQAGANTYVVKPFTQESLKAKIDSLIG